MRGGPDPPGRWGSPFAAAVGNGPAPAGESVGHWQNGLRECRKFAKWWLFSMAEQNKRRQIEPYLSNAHRPVVGIASTPYGRF